MRHHHHVDVDVDNRREHYHHDHSDDVEPGHHHNLYPPFNDDECCNDFFDVGTVFHDDNADHVHAATAVHVDLVGYDDDGPRFG